MNILIEGWRGINHSFSLVNQWQTLELSKLSKVFLKDVEFPTIWNFQKNSSGINYDTRKLIEDFENPLEKQKFDITYRISFPFNFDKNFDSKKLFVFGTTEYKYLKETHYKNGKVEEINENEKIIIHTPSNWSKKGFLNSGFHEEKIIVVPHGIDPNTFDIVSEEEKKSFKKKLNLNNEDFIISNIGSMTKNKGIEVLITAYGILKKRFKNLKLILKDQSNLYGIKPNLILSKLNNSELNKKYKIIYEQMIKDIIIISKNLNLDDLKKIYAISNCYISPYLAEGFNLTPLEAAACGTEIIVTKGGSTDDYFNKCMGEQIESDEKKIKNYFQLNPSLDSLIAILEKKIITQDKSANIRRDYIHKNFSWEIIAKKLKHEFKIKIEN